MYRQEYPRPDFVRNNWLNLNGEWQLGICSDNTDYNIDSQLDKTIQVPFCIESELSKVQHLDFINKAVYRRTFTLDKLSEKTIINFQAAFYEAIVYVNKKEVGSHSGGYTPFSFDISQYIIEGENTLDVVVKSDVRDLSIPSGKQSLKQDSFFCFYTRSTGLWQTVWLEFLSRDHLTCPKITPNVGSKTINFNFIEPFNGILNIAISYKGKELYSNNFEYSQNIDVKLNEIELWSIGKGNLYDIKLKLIVNDEIKDEVDTYTAFRKAELKGQYFYLNDEKVMLKLVLDQGYYPDGIYTPKNVKEIEDDIDYAIDFGFNGARPHMKVFDPYYFYYADKKGFLTYGEFANWSCDFRQANIKGYENLMREWKEVLARDYNHPSIIGWCPLNETWRVTDQKCDYISQKNLVELTKSYDNTRMVIGSSGGDLYAGDVWDIHTYEHNEEKLKKIIKRPWLNKYYLLSCIYCYDRKKRLKKSVYRKLPHFLSEYGGFTYLEKGKTWGYKGKITSEEEFVSKFIGLTNAAFSTPIMGICYTQLYDVEQEQNGLLKYSREPKLSEAAREKIKTALSQGGEKC